MSVAARLLIWATFGSSFPSADFPSIFRQAIVAAVHSAGCPNLSVADAVQVTGAAAVFSLGGPQCALLMGRPDSGSTDSTAGLPNHCDDAGTGIGRFTSMGFVDPVTSLTVLSGAHNIGQSRVTTRSQCSKGTGTLTAQSNSFDGHYYTEVVQQTGKRG